MEDLVLNGALIFGTVWGGVKISMNGIYSKLDKTDAKVDTVQETLSLHGERLARVETKLEE